MAFMAMEIVLKINKQFCTLIICTLSLHLEAGEWTFTPSLNMKGIYTNNIKLVNNAQIHSFVSQSNLEIDTQFKSRIAQFSLQSSNTYVTYSYDHELDDDFRTLTANARYFLWKNGPAVIANANIFNVAKNRANNSLADLVSGDTVETRNQQAGILYNIDNSGYTITSSIIYSAHNSDDNIGESNGFKASINTTNFNTVSKIFWQINADYSERSNSDLTGRMHKSEILIGFSTPMQLTPFFRYFNEDSNGKISTGNNHSMSSWGPGIRWRLSSSLFINTSYNYDGDKEASDDYVSAEINWEPSIRTSLIAGYSRRFFGDSYSLQFNHKTKRLTNNISYIETVNAFDRNSYQQIDLGSFWCPADTDIDVNQCFVPNDDTTNFEDFKLITLFDQILVQSNGFSLTKSLSWSSTFSLARTNFSFTASNNERESLNSGIIDTQFNSRFSISRRISGKGDIKVNFRFDHNQLNKYKISNSGQVDYYRSVSATYSKKIARSLVSDITVQYLVRSSDFASRNYSEARATINIKKDF